MVIFFGTVAPLTAQQAQAPAAIPVSVVAAEKKPVTKSQDFVGRVEAIQRVEIKARVTGYLEKVAFKEGDLIKSGTELYSIEKGLFEAAVGQAEGALAKDLSALQDRYPDVEIGSYPYFRRGDFGVTLVLRGTDRDRLATATDELKILIRALGGDPQEGLSEG